MPGVRQARYGCRFSSCDLRRESRCCPPHTRRRSGLVAECGSDGKLHGMAERQISSLASVPARVITHAALALPHNTTIFPIWLNTTRAVRISASTKSTPKTIYATGRRNRSEPRKSGTADMIVPTKNARSAGPTAATTGPMNRLVQSEIGAAFPTHAERAWPTFDRILKLTKDRPDGAVSSTEPSPSPPAPRMPGPVVAPARRSSAWVPSATRLPAAPGTWNRSRHSAIHGECTGPTATGRSLRERVGEGRYRRLP